MIGDFRLTIERKRRERVECRPPSLRSAALPVGSTKLSSKGIADLDAAETAKIPVSGQQFRNSVLETEHNDVSVVN